MFQRDTQSSLAQEEAWADGPMFLSADAPPSLTSNLSAFTIANASFNEAIDCCGVHNYGSNTLFDREMPGNVQIREDQ